MENDTSNMMLENKKMENNNEKQQSTLPFYK